MIIWFKLGNDKYQTLEVGCLQRKMFETTGKHGPDSWPNSLKIFQGPSLKATLVGGCMSGMPLNSQKDLQHFPASLSTWLCKTYKRDNEYLLIRLECIFSTSRHTCNTLTIPSHELVYDIALATLWENPGVFACPVWKRLHQRFAVFSHAMTGHEMRPLLAHERNLQGAELFREDFQEEMGKFSRNTCVVSQPLRPSCQVRPCVVSLHGYCSSRLEVDA